MKNKRKKLRVIGKTTEGTLVVEGIFPIMDTLGMPLDHVFDMLRIKDMIPSWNCFYDEAKEAGWIDRTIFTRLSEGIGTTYRPEMRDVVLDRLKTYTMMMVNKQ